MKVLKVKTDSVTNNFIDKETGEFVNQEVNIKHHKIVVEDDETFFWIYNSLIAIFADLSKTELKILVWASTNAQWNSNIIGLGKPVCSEIEKIMKIGYQTIKDAISSLKDKNILIAQGSGYYRVNPKYCWRGRSGERLRTMKLVLEVECPDCLSPKDIKEVATLPENKDFLEQVNQQK